MDLTRNVLNRPKADYLESSLRAFTDFYYIKISHKNKN